MTGNHTDVAPYDLNYTYDTSGQVDKLGDISTITDNITAITATYTYPTSGPAAVRPRRDHRGPYQR